jgi:membrane protease YdiL (CAAX protease family)
MACLFFAFCAALIVAAALSGPIYMLCNAIDSTPTRYVTGKGLCKIYERVMLLTAIVAIPFFLKKCRIKNLISANGTPKSPGFLRLFLAWIVFGMLFFCLVAALEIMLTGMDVSHDRHVLEVFISKLPRFVFCAITVGVLEEILFRGIVLKMFYTAFSPITAVILSSALFACLHTKIPLAAGVTDASIGPLSGFRCLGPMVFGFLYKFDILQFAKLALFGIILSTITIKNKSLIPAVGFHAGVVLMLFSAKVFTQL